MKSFKDKLRNLFNDELLNNKTSDLEKNLNQSIIDTQRKIKRDNNSSNLTERKVSMKKYLNNFELFNKSNIPTNNIKIKRALYKNNTLGKLVLNKISYNYNNINSGNSDVNKIYKKLYNISYNNIKTNNYSNKVYLKYKHKEKPFLFINTNLNQNNNRLYMNNINQNKNNNNNHKLLRKYSSYSNENNNENNYQLGVNNKNITNRSKLLSNIYQNLMIDLEKRENDAVIIKDKKRISNSIKKKINSIIGENNLDNISHKNNISNKIPRVLTSELLQFDTKYYNDISPIKKFTNLNKSKNKNNLKYNNYNSFYNNDNDEYNKKLKSSYLSYYNLSQNKYYYNHNENIN